MSVLIVFLFQTTVADSKPLPYDAHTHQLQIQANTL